VTDRRLTHNAAVPPQPIPPQNRLEERVGPQMARLLLSALAAGGYRERPDRDRGVSSP
jgi:hypothetical protein